MVKKGIVEEIFSKAMFSSESNQCVISFRDFEKIRKTTLPKFIIQSDRFQKIAPSRITKSRRSSTILFEKISKKDG